MYKVMCIFGTRPEAIKMAPVIHAIEQHPQLQGIVCISAQHREMLDSVLETFKIKPDHDLNIMKHGQTLHSITCDILERLTPVLQDEKPDMILVHGDTTTTFAAALAAFYQQIAIGHVEAGLRTYHKYSPYPEEMNRQLVSRMADLHFAPTATSRDNLLQEHIREEQIIVTGNTAIDALKLTECEAYDHEALRWADGHRILLLTAHRRENQGQGLRQIYAAVRTLCETYPDIRVIYPCHMNPNIRKLSQDVPVWYLVQKIDDQAIADAKALGGECGIDFNGNKDENTKEVVQKCLDAGLEVGAWTIDNMDTLQSLKDKGVTYITTDSITY